MTPSVLEMLADMPHWFHVLMQVLELPFLLLLALCITAFIWLPVVALIVAALRARS